MRPVCLPIALAVNACVAVWQGSYNVALRNSQSIVIEFDPAVANLPMMAKIAQDHCQSVGTDAVLQSESKSNLGILVHTYRCVPKFAEKESVRSLRASVAALKVGAWNEGERLATRALSVGELNTTQAAAAYVLRSYARAKMGRIGEARTDLGRAISLKPDLMDTPSVREFRDTIAPGRTQPRPRDGETHAPRPQRQDIPPPIIEF